MKKLLFILGLIYASRPFALPQGLGVHHGNACTSSKVESELLIKASDNAILHWDEFSIKASEKVHFELSSNLDSVLNRVTSEIPSEILGELSSNGSLYLVNPNGIVIGKEGNINTMSFIASTLELSNADFLEKNELSFIGESKEPIINLGRIRAKDGDALLFSYQIQNDGDISAQNLTSIAAGSHIIYKPMGDEHVLIKLNDQNFKKIEKGIHSTGSIEGNVVEIKTDGNLYALAINQEGIVTTHVDKENGKILIRADHGSMHHSGQINSPSGKVELFANKIDLGAYSTIDVSGSNGGEVYIGEKAHTHTLLSHVGSNIFADGSSDGDGGKVLLWSDNVTSFKGEIFCRGGLLSGNGGFVEVSSAYLLNYAGSSNLDAPFGETGTLLLDPTIIISSFDSLLALEPKQSEDNFFPVDTIETALRSANVVIRGAADGYDVVIGDDISNRHGNTLDVTGKSITIKPGITLENYKSTILLQSTVGNIRIEGSLGINSLGGTLKLHSANDIDMSSAEASITVDESQVDITAMRDFLLTGIDSQISAGDNSTVNLISKRNFNLGSSDSTSSLIEITGDNSTINLSCAGQLTGEMGGGALFDNAGMSALNIDAKNDITLSNSLILNNRLASHQTTDIKAENDIYFGLNSSYQANSGNLNITAGNDIFLDGGKTSSQTEGNVILIAGRNFSSTVPSSNIFVNGSGNLTIVIDHKFPEHPEFGPGTFTMNSSIVESSSLDEVNPTFRFYLNQYSEEPMLGDLFVDGIAYTFDDASMDFDVYYPDGNVIPPFSLYFKPASKIIVQGYKAVEITEVSLAELSYSVNSSELSYSLNSDEWEDNDE